MYTVSAVPVAPETDGSTRARARRSFASTGIDYNLLKGGSLGRGSNLQRFLGADGNSLLVTTEPSSIRSTSKATWA